MRFRHEGRNQSENDSSEIRKYEISLRDKVVVGTYRAWESSDGEKKLFQTFDLR